MTRAVEHDTMRSPDRATRPKGGRPGASPATFEEPNVTADVDAPPRSRLSLVTPDGPGPRPAGVPGALPRPGDKRQATTAHAVPAWPTITTAGLLIVIAGEAVWGVFGWTGALVAAAVVGLVTVSGVAGRHRSVRRRLGSTLGGRTGGGMPGRSRIGRPGSVMSRAAGRLGLGPQSPRRSGGGATGRRPLIGGQAGRAGSSLGAGRPGKRVPPGALGTRTPTKATPGTAGAGRGAVPGRRRGLGLLGGKAGTSQRPKPGGGTQPGASKRRWWKKRQGATPGGGGPHRLTKTTPGKATSARPAPGQTRGAPPAASKPAAVVPRPRPATSRPATPPAAPTRPDRGTTQGGRPVPSHLPEIGAEANAYFSGRDPQSMRDVEDDLRAMQPFLADIGNATRTLHARAVDQYPMAPGVTMAIGHVYELLTKAVEAAGDIHPAFRALHEEEIKRHEQPRPGERMWDVERGGQS